MKKILGGYLLGVLSLVACAGVQYKYYGLSLPDADYEHGMLLGKLGSGGWPDLPFTECRPDAVNKGRCVHMLREEYLAMWQDLETTRAALKNCQEGKP